MGDEDGDEDGEEDKEEDVEEEGAVELPDEAVVKCSVWRIVSDFIRSSTGEEPYECEHFYLSDLLDHLAGAGQPDSLLDYITELIRRYTDICSIKDDDVWIEHLCPAEAQNAFDWRSRTEPINRSGHRGGGSPVPCFQYVFY